MKAETPEKIYIFKNLITNAPDDRWLSKRSDDNDIEYTRTDAFVEKACDAYCKVCKMPNCRRNECKWLSDFKGYLQTI